MHGERDAAVSTPGKTAWRSGNTIGCKRAYCRAEEIESGREEQLATAAQWCGDEKERRADARAKERAGEGPATGLPSKAGRGRHVSGYRINATRQTNIVAKVYPASAGKMKAANAAGLAEG